jgi:hypothetical protein
VPSFGRYQASSAMTSPFLIVTEPSNGTCGVSRRRGCWGVSTPMTESSPAFSV